ncbi:histidine kinase [Streptomyces sp. FH025]|uniref:sensor histidine kinase n=1 Tax=Streptomyces sp. FH025 TaxID=2815937 RepID=UPI0027DAD6D1|nr:histidine kinase [Streptomyces sp. FH025]
MTLASFLLITFLNILALGLSGPVEALGIGIMLLIAAIQLRHSATGADRAPTRLKAATLGAQAVLTYLPIVLFHANWGSMAGFLGASVLLLVPARKAWPLFGLIVLSMLVNPVLDGKGLLECVYMAESTMLCGIAVFGLTRLACMVHEVHAARGELARMAVANERLRFARDLHDVLGYSLSAITLKSELIHRLIPNNPRRAMEETAEVLTLSRQSLSDVRMVARGVRDMSLEQEISSVSSVLGSAELKLEIEASLGELNPQVDGVLATILREAVTNVLRHSKATTCRIEAVAQHGWARLCVINDGVDARYRDTCPNSGSGLRNMEQRLAAIGGTLSAGCGPDGRFQLLANAPLDPSRHLAVVDSGAAEEAV